MRRAVEQMDDLVGNLPQIGAATAAVVAGVYAVRRILSQDDEWERIVKQKDADLNRKDAEIAALKTELAAKGPR
mgnify:FL=1